MSEGRAGMWRAFTIVLAVVCVGLAAALSQQRGSAGTDPQAAATVTVTVTAGQEVTPGEPSVGDDAGRDEFLLAMPRRIEGDPMAMGAVDAPVVLTEWADYRCPFCNVWATDTLPLLQPLVDAGTLRIEFRDLAIFGDDSVNAAAAARAAGEQGLFWEFQHAMYASIPAQGHPPVGDDKVEQVAREVGVPDMARFMADYRSDAVRDAIRESSAEAQQLGISSTPTFLIGTEVISGAQPVEVFQQIIGEQAAKHG